MRNFSAFVTMGVTKLLLICASLTPAFIICQEKGASVAVLCVACSGAAFFFGSMTAFDAGRASGYHEGHKKGLNDLENIAASVLKKEVRRG